jgi:hypothetical protein
MNDVRVTLSGSKTIVELLTKKAKNWYASSVPGAPAVSPNSVVLGQITAKDLEQQMTKDGLIVTHEEG